MKRKITSKLYEWKNMLNGRMPLFIFGARQVGKTFDTRDISGLCGIAELNTNRYRCCSVAPFLLVS